MSRFHPTQGPAVLGNESDGEFNHPYSLIKGETPKKNRNLMFMIGGGLNES